MSRSSLMSNLNKKIKKKKGNSSKSKERESFLASPLNKWKQVLKPKEQNNVGSVVHQTLNQA